jgi:trehalose 2-sulfotransferase
MPRASYLVMGTPRCGTGLLRSLLTSTGVAGRPEEYFWRDTMAELMSRWGVDEDGYLARVRSEATTPNGVLAANLMWTYLGDAEETLRRQSGATGSGHALFASVFPEPHYVWIWRDDVVAEGVSWARAELSGGWFAGQVPGGAGTPGFDLALVHNLVWVAMRLQVVARRWFAAHGLRPHLVRYEDLAADVEGTTRALLAYVDLEPPAGWAPAPATRRQADDVTADWTERYRHGARRLPAGLPLITDPLPREIDWR